MPNPDPAAALSFLPWVRQGAAAAITTPDSLGPAQRGVADLAALIAVNDTPPLSVAVRLRGPADVVGIDTNQIVRMDPRPGSSDFEPNYFPCIEFDRADFPWLFTPAKAGTGSRLRPWLCLVVVRKQDGVTLGPAVGAPLSALRIAAPARPADELPDPDEVWAWAHAQAAADDTSAAAVGAALGGAPALSLSRLLCPRLLAPDTDYFACLVPTFDLGRRAGLGLPIADADLIAAKALATAWLLKPTAPTEVVLPVYHHWDFRTGVGGDFESLVRLLRPQPIPEGLGRRPVDISQPGFGITPALPAGTTLALEGALQAMESPDADAPWSEDTAQPFQTALAAIVNAPGASELADPQADPLLAPPLYGRWYAARATVARGAADWFDRLNLDPRHRSVAAFGTRVVQEHQEALMAAAWEQAADLRQANQRMRQLQLSLAVGTSLHARHFARMSTEAILRVAAPAFGRVRSATGGDGLGPTLTATLASSALPVRATSSAMRRLGSARGPLTRRLATQGVVRASLPSWVARLSSGNAMVFITPTVPEQATVESIRGQLPAQTVLRRHREVTDALIAGTGTRPRFGVVAEGAPLPVPTSVVMIQLPDSAAAAAFRQAAAAHLQRIDPARSGILFGPPPPLRVQDVQETLIAQTRPRLALVTLARAVVATGANALPPVDTPSSVSVGIDTVMAAPRFRQPMYEPLRDLGQELLLPGLDTVAPNSVLGLKTNRRFVEAYMVGLNVEMARELLWRGYPTDQRGTCFDQFWDVQGAPAPQPDIRALHLWAGRPLGDPATAPAREQFVMLLRSSLLRRYPDAIICATRALVTGGVRSPSELASDEVLPAFRGSLEPDLSFFGFNLPAATVTGSDGTPGYYLVIQEHPTAPRFGLDVGTPAGNASHLGIAAGPPAGLPPGGLQWGRNSAHMAGITRQLPVRVAIHASLFVTAV